MKATLPKTLLVVEDDTLLRESLTECATGMGWAVRGCDNADAALALAESFKPTVIFSDVFLAKGDGRRVLAKLRENAGLADCQFVLMTGDWVGASRRESIELEADAYLPKPFSLDEFTSCLEERYRQAGL